MRFLILLFFCVILIQYLRNNKENFEGTCIKDLKVDFTKSKLKIGKIISLYSDGTKDISNKLQKFKNLDFDYDTRLDDFLKNPLSTDYMYLDEKNCKLNYMF